MDAKMYKFKTNINCGGCIKAVTPHFEKVNQINSWEVDTENPEKILTVNAEGISPAEIMAIIQKAGFEIEEII